MVRLTVPYFGTQLEVFSFLDALGPPQIDDLTLPLLGLLAVLLIYKRFFSTPPPLVHPLLLGKQSEVSAVRKRGETGVYRCFATGHGTPFQVRPGNGVKTVRDVVPAEGVEPRHILDLKITNEALTELLRLIPLGLAAMFDLPLGPSAETTTEAPIAVLLPRSPSTALPLLLLQLASPPGCPIIPLPSPTLLDAALNSTAHARPRVLVVYVDLLEEALEQAFEDKGEGVGALVVGDPDMGKRDIVERARRKGMKVHWWEDMWEEGEKSSAEVPEGKFDSTQAYFYHSSGAGKEPTCTKFSHINITSGMAGVLSLFPASQRPTRKDVVASAVPLTTPLGMSIALACIWAGASFRLIGPPTPAWPMEAEREPQDDVDELQALGAGAGAGSDETLPPTVLFVSAKHHLSIVHRLHLSLMSHPLGAFAARHKSKAIEAGYVSREGFWDRTVLSGTRESVLGGIAGKSLRGVIVVGDAPPPAALPKSHLLLSLPLTRLHPSPFSAGPVFVSHYNDVQSSFIADLAHFDLGRSPARAHVGPPGVNVEIKLRGEERALAAGLVGRVGPGDRARAQEDRQGEPGQEDGLGALEGWVWARGPALGEKLGRAPRDAEGWVELEERAGALTNGCFVVRPSGAGSVG